MGGKFLSLCLLVVIINVSAEWKVRKATRELIEGSCKGTRYPAKCVESLMGYAGSIGESEEKLAMSALSVSVWKSRSCASFVEKMGSVKGMKARERNAVEDCIENMNDSLERLSQSLRELGLVVVGKAKRKDFLWHISNVQTWVSAAITDQDTCLDSFDGPHLDAKLKAAIKPRVVDAYQVTTNALALVNRFASKYPSASASASLP
ncbi:hypothetical protein VNO78_24164 [Psophocarpus tetragonolobus]|uniref:Pectinesterase inhibitor domain-containing protein n=1 Tax=Psophocarpus tetragonolobus TaxID=3891 RepID=A0AAN9XF07_PSOTE